MSKLIVTMTSWTKRIGNVCQVVKSIMRNTVVPDRLYLNLSSEEFEDEELPKDLIGLFDSDDRLIINWVDGPNTKSFKKMFPILQYLDDDDIILECDDDFTVPPDLIECRLRDFDNNGRKHPISGNPGLSSIGDSCVVAPTTMFSKRMVANWKKFVNETVLCTYNDDRTLLYLFWLNGYLVKPCTRYTSRYLKQHFPVNPTCPLKGQYPIGPAYDEAVDPVVRELTGGKPIRESFGYFRRADIISVPSDNGKHDVVMPWCRKGVASDIMTCGDRLEIEFVVGSLKKYCSSWLGRIFVVGSEPPASIKEDVIHIPCDDPYVHAKDANIIHKILHACETVKDLSDDFLKVSDDQIVTCETAWEDLTPRIVREYGDWTEQQWQRNRLVDRWHQGLYQTLHLFDLKKACFFEPHIWAPFNKFRYMEMCDKYNWRKNIACIDNTLYYNFIEQPPVRPFDHIHLSRGKAKEMVQSLDPDNLPRFLTWTDPAYVEKRFRDILEKTVFG